MCSCFLSSPRHSAYEKRSENTKSVTDSCEFVGLVADISPDSLPFLCKWQVVECCFSFCYGVAVRVSDTSRTSGAIGNVDFNSGRRAIFGQGLADSSCWSLVRFPLRTCLEDNSILNEFDIVVVISFFPNFCV